MTHFFTVKIFKDLLFNELKYIYSKDEIIAIFNILILNRCNISKIDTILNPDTPINSDILISDLERLKRSEPLQYILQVTPFFDLNFKVTPAVLIPRQETEELVDLIIKEFYSNTNRIKILDVGTGSGAIAICLAKNLPNSQVFASDFSQNAIHIATENALNNEVKVNFINHDIFHDLIKLLPYELDVVVSNPPYIPISMSDKLHDNVIKYEPHSALFVPDDDPLLFYRKISEVAFDLLKPKGKLFFETYEDFHFELIQILKNMGYEKISSILDLQQKPRFIIAEKNVSLP